MNVTQAIKQRHSTRAYLDKAVSKQQVQSILEVARFAPSGVNTQPWQVAIVSGQSKLSLQQQMQTAFESGDKESMDYHYYPTHWVEPYKSRRIATGTELYTALNISREDKERRIQQWQANYRAFDAPIMLLFFMDPTLETGSYLDYGMLLQNIMLLAEEEGLATCPQGALGKFPKLIKNFLNYEESLILLGGMALGYEDKEHAVNQYRTSRVAVAEFSEFFE